jgi:hypothetical protein
MQANRLAGRVRLVTSAEDRAALGMEHTRADELVDPAARLERRVELDERLRPEVVGVEVPIDKRAGVRLLDRDEPADVPTVLFDQPLAEREDVHGPPVDR